MKPLVTILALAFLHLHSAAQDLEYRGLPEWSVRKRDSTEYLLYTPQHIQQTKRYPIALFLHGCCGKDDKVSLRNAVDPPVRMWHNFGADTQQVPTYIISPATSRGWSQHINTLKAVIDDLIANHQGDPQRVYICGFSMGAGGTYEFVQRYPGFFAAAIAIGMAYSGDVQNLKDTPFWMIQGEEDHWSKNMKSNVTAMRRLNGSADDTGSTLVTNVNPRYTNFKGLGHVVMWEAASRYDLTGWAYSIVNDSKGAAAGRGSQIPGVGVARNIATAGSGSSGSPAAGVGGTIETAAPVHSGSSATGVVGNIATVNETPCRLALVEPGTALFFEKGDSANNYPREINFSKVGAYKGLTLIQSAENSYDSVKGNAISFQLEKPATVYVAYEDLDGPSATSTPEWLGSFRKQQETIEAQYRYFDVYKKKYEAGQVMIGSNGPTESHGRFFIMIGK